MKDGEKSPDMSDLYKVLKYLPKARVDRQEPCVFNSIFVDGEEVVIPTVYSEFNGTDYLLLYVNCHGVDVDVTSLKLGFSALLNGNVSLLSLNSSDTELDLDNDTIINFTIDENYSADDQSKLLTGVESIKLNFNQDATGVEILKIVLRSVDYTYTLSDIETAYYNGEGYVLRRLNNMRNEKKGIKEIPKLLQQYVYMAAGAYAWLTRWEYEAKPMKEPKSESNNYADRLFGQVDSAIENYLSNIENNRNEEYLHLEQVATAGITWGIR